MSDVAVPIMPREDQQGRTERWLIEQVAPVLERVVTQGAQEGDWQVFDRFAQIIHKHQFARMK